MMLATSAGNSEWKRNRDSQSCLARPFLHSFRVVALDGNPVPNPVTVPLLWQGTAERISAIVEMNHDKTAANHGRGCESHHSGL
jgi:FtsP/CotA-like multicopper oxidase with cupredoxin domain